MPKTQAEQLQELNAALTEMSTNLKILTERVAEHEKVIQNGVRRDEEFIAKSAVAEERITQLRTDVSTLREELRRALERLAVSEAKNAALEERARNQEKSSDRGWNIGQAAIISVISMIGGALLSLLVQLAIKK